MSSSKPLTILACLLIMLACLPARGENDCMATSKALSRMELHDVTLVTGERVLPLTVRVADDRQEQSAGFQHICPSTIAETRILFVFPRETLAAFHMRNVRDRLDIGFFSADGKLLSVHEMQPYAADARGGRLTMSGEPFQYALEARAGFFAQHALASGATRLVLDNTLQPHGQP